MLLGTIYHTLEVDYGTEMKSQITELILLEKKRFEALFE